MILMASIFRTRDGLPLCANTDMDVQTHKSVKDCNRYIKLLSKKLYSFPDRCTLSLDGYNIHFIWVLDQCCMALTEATYPTVLAFCFLSEIQREFLKCWTHDNVREAQRPYSFMKFDPELQKAKQRYNRPRNLTTRVNLADMSLELKLRPPYQVQESDLVVKHNPLYQPVYIPGQLPLPNHTNSHNSYSSKGSSYRPVLVNVRPVNWVCWLSIAINIFCALLNFIRGMSIISHGHFDSVEDSGAYRYGCTFLLAVCLLAFQIYIIFRSFRMRTTVAALTWLAVCFSIIYVAHFRNLLQIIFHMAANTFITFLIYMPAHNQKLPGYTV